jgi:transposase
VIVVGIDPHKQTHTAVAVAAGTGQVLGELTLRARVQGFERLVAWARALDDERVFAVEDCRHVSGGLERHLIARGERTVRVAPKLMASHRRTDRTFGKSDPIDAKAVAIAALRHRELPEARLAGPEREIGLLAAHREDLVAERTRACNRLRWLLHDLDPDLVPAKGVLDRTVALTRLHAMLADSTPSTEVSICLEITTRIGQINVRERELARRIERLIGEVAPALLEIPGCAALTAAKLVAEIANVDRFATEARFAMHAGVAPLQASSGASHRHRLNRRGNRQLNAALHRIAITQLRIHDPAKIFIARKRAEGMSNREALRCLKRQLARVVFTTMRTIDRSTAEAAA